MRGEKFFKGGPPIFLNRERETFALSLHNHDFVELCLVEQGAGFHYINDWVGQVEQGDLFLLPVGVSHVFRPFSADRSHALIVLNCIFESQALASQMSWLSMDSPLYNVLFRGETTPQWLRFHDEEDKIHRLLDLAYLEYYQRIANHEAMLVNLLSQVLINLERMHCGDELVLPARGESRYGMSDIIQYIQNHSHERVSLKETAERVFMSPSHFQQQFKQTTGQTFNQYVQHSRIRRSCELLKTTDYTIQQIAQQSGYQDMKHYHALFRRITGLTPRVYRIKYRPSG